MYLSRSEKCSCISWCSVIPAMVRSESGVREFLSSPSSASTPSQVIAVPDPEGREGGGSVKIV